MRTRKSGGYRNYPDRVPAPGDNVIIDNNTYTVTEYKSESDMVTLNDGRELSRNELDLQEVEQVADQPEQEVEQALDQPEQEVEQALDQTEQELSNIEQDSEHSVDEPSYEDSEIQDGEGGTDDATELTVSESEEKEPSLSESEEKESAATDKSDNTRGGKRLKTKRKVRWNNKTTKATVAVVATTMALDKGLSPDSSGGKSKRKRSKLSTRKKPRRLKQRVR